MSNKFVTEFHELCTGPLSIYDAVAIVIKTYIYTRNYWLEHPKEQYFSTSKTKKNIELMNQVLNLISELTHKGISLANDELTMNFRSKEQVYKEIDSKVSKFSKGKGRELIQVFLVAMKHEEPQVCCCCHQDKKVLKKCNICNNNVCEFDSKKLGRVECLPPRLKDNHFLYNWIVCDKCRTFFQNYVPIMRTFSEKIYPRYKYFILGHVHTRSYYSGTSFLYHLLTNGYLENIVAFVEHLHSDFRDYTNNDITRQVFSCQLNNFQNENTVDSNITDVLEQYTNNHAAYFIASPEITALQAVCEMNRVPLYTFDNTATSGGKPQEGWERRRLEANQVIAQRILQESKRHPDAKVFIPIGKDHIRGKFSLQQYLSNSCAIDCSSGRASLTQTNHASSLKAQYKLSWPNLFEYPFFTS
ncbi:MAG: hypothetical protein GY750_04420 [Lentisphaerae bacterium]|nr:hypothetical protein [Lentisphaerota bacterium]MCP4100656.1 hypothetical protein [Lentisphaerota bacterium]